MRIRDLMENKKSTASAKAADELEPSKFVNIQKKSDIFNKDARDIDRDQEFVRVVGILTYLCSTNL